MRKAHATAAAADDDDAGICTGAQDPSEVRAGSTQAPGEALADAGEDHGSRGGSGGPRACLVVDVLDASQCSSRPPHAPLGPALARQRHLASRGHAVLPLPWRTWQQI